MGFFFGGGSQSSTAKQAAIRYELLGLFNNLFLFHWSHVKDTHWLELRCALKSTNFIQNITKSKSEYYKKSGSLIEDYRSLVIYIF